MKVSVAVVAIAQAAVASLVACGNVLGVEDVYLQEDGGAESSVAAVDDASSLDAADGSALTLDAADAMADARNVPASQPGDTSECDRVGSVFFLDGAENDVIHPEQVWRYGGLNGWDVVVAPTGDSVTFAVQAADEEWHLDIGTAKIPASLSVGTFENAERYSKESSGHPGLSVRGNGRDCATVTGTIWIESLLWKANDISLFVAAFEQRCNGSDAVLRGCVRYSAP